MPKKLKIEKISLRSRPSVNIAKSSSRLLPRENLIAKGMHFTSRHVGSTWAETTNRSTTKPPMMKSQSEGNVSQTRTMMIMMFHPLFWKLDYQGMIFASRKSTWNRIHFYVNFRTKTFWHTRSKLRSNRKCEKTISCRWCIWKTWIKDRFWTVKRGNFSVNLKKQRKSTICLPCTTWTKNAAVLKLIITWTIAEQRNRLNKRKMRKCRRRWIIKLRVKPMFGSLTSNWKTYKR